MKILFVTSRLPAPPNDGGASYIYHLIKGLFERNHTNYIASFISNLHPQNIEEAEGIGRLYAKKIHFKKYGILAALKATISRNSVHIQHRMNRSLFKQILDTVDVEPEIIVLCGLHNANFLDQLRKKFPSIPIVLLQVNIEHKLLYQNAKNSRNLFLKLFLIDQYRLLRKFEIESIKKTDGLISISNSDLKVFDEISEFNDAIVVPPGAKEIRGITFENRQNNLILAYGSWDWTPNRDGIVWFLDKVWNPLKQAHPNLVMKIAGTGLPKKVIKSLPKGIEYLGFVDDLTLLQKTCVLQIIPLISGSGVKLKVIEAMSAEIPFVTTSFGVEGTKLVDKEHCLVANNETEFFERISELLNSESLRRQISANAYSLFKQEYSWDIQVKILESYLYKKVNT